MCKARRVRLFHTLAIVESLLTVWFILIYDVQYSWRTWKWLFTHAGCVFLYSFYASCALDKPLREVDKMAMNALCSVLFLLLFGHTSGETLSVLQFEHLYRGHFHFSCCCSGVFGTLIMISYCKLCSQVGVQMVRFYNIFVMLFVSSVSLFVFPTFMSPFLFCIILVGYMTQTVEMYYQIHYLDAPTGTKGTGKQIVVPAEEVRELRIENI